jgi:DNA topoisomerase-1
MRTDSVRNAPEAVSSVRGYISEHFGQAGLPESPRLFQVKKSAQDAHEAIRPTNVYRTPDSIKKYLTKDQSLLYSLIWKRFVASQMNPAVYDTVSCDIKAGDRYTLRATGSQLKESGFLALYEEKQDENTEKEENLLPELTIGQTIYLDSIKTDQVFTRPPPRFTEATLIKELEKSGIGRPSTYAAIMKKILARDYTTKEQNRLKPTELGRVVTEMLEKSFEELMNIGFTASMEDSLEEIAENRKEWREVLAAFWTNFSKTLEIAKEEARPAKILTDIICPQCQSPMQKIWFKSKYFLGCSKYPDCSYTTSLEQVSFNKEDYREDFDWDQACPKCQAAMKVRFGRFGAFLGCSQYPTCRGIVRIPKKDEPITSTDQHPCPAADCDGHLVQRRSRFGKVFWSCSNFPDCDAAGPTPEEVQSKFEGRPKTAYVKKAQATKSAKSTKPAKSTKSVKPKKTTRKKKEAEPEE